MKKPETICVQGSYRPKSGEARVCPVAKSTTFYYENAQDISALHMGKASEENLELRAVEIEPDEYDDHSLHIVEHTRFLLSAEFKRIKDKELLKKRFMAHIQAHKRLEK